MKLKAKLKQWIHNHIPVSRKKFEQQLIRHHDEIQELNYKHEKEMSEMKKYLDDVMPRLIRISFENFEQSYSQRYRIVIEFQEEFVHNALDWGNDDRMISYYGNYVGQYVARELKSINQFRKVHSRKFEA